MSWPNELVMGNFQVQARLLPRREQRLHPLGDVRDRWKCGAHHQQPRQQISSTGQSFCERGIKISLLVTYAFQKQD